MPANRQNEVPTIGGLLANSRPSSNKPFVSVVIPCYNEERYILKTLDRLADQYDNERYEIVIVDGKSEDRTRELIAQFQLTHPELKVVTVDNPARDIPVALNLGIREARGQIVARMDAHATPSPGYIRRCVEVLAETKAGVVGMPCRIFPGGNSGLARVIAKAVSHPFGIGDARYRLQNGTELLEAVDTVAFACFPKSLWEEIGGFNESLLTNEDYEFNFRVRSSGRQVVLDRSGHCDYFARGSLSELAHQYSRYGRWKARMLRLHPTSIKLRHVVAPAFVLTLLTLIVWSLFWSGALALLGLIVVVYLASALSFGWQMMRSNQLDWRTWILTPVVFATIHLTWGVSFLLGLFLPHRGAAN
jgi:glycosyltransferase involved in cell wall biosynthesis